ncbi:hypothetical protein P3X46_025993 [Hevea brasiliensis]|uniref:Auxin-responsive protein SAUR68-like n=2 Tax=Hevea brasiliensis TaxID=3981 RepID=A0ABQ9KXA7_HEVBR|nr:hypothetical protein P3X46_025993 [Hevea brasiliensis]
MISPRKLIKIARKWQKIAAMRRKRISFPRLKGNRNTDFSQASSAGSGNFVIYTIDGIRFVIPLAYLSSDIFRELFKMSEEVFGLPSEGPIKLPCDAVFMGYTVSLIQKGLGKDIEKALLTSKDTTCCSTSAGFPQGHTGKQFLVCGY